MSPPKLKNPAPRVTENHIHYKSKRSKSPCPAISTEPLKLGLRFNLLILYSTMSKHTNTKYADIYCSKGHTSELLWLRNVVE